MKFVIYFAALISVLGWQVSCDDNENVWVWGGGGADFESWVRTVTTWEDFGNGILDHLPKHMSLANLMEIFNGNRTEAVKAIIDEIKLVAFLTEYSSVPIVPEKRQEQEGNDTNTKKSLTEETSANTLDAQNEIPSWSNYTEKKGPERSKKGRVNPKAPRTITSIRKNLIDALQ